MKNAKEIMEALLAGETLQSTMTFAEIWMENGGFLTAGHTAATFDIFKYPKDWVIKPKVRQINGVDVPTPHRKKLENGQEYFTPSVNNLTGYRDYIWRNSHTDNRRLNAGVIHMEPEAAAQHTKAFLSLTAE